MDCRGRLALLSSLLSRVRPVFIDVIVVAFIIYFIVVPIIVVLLLVFDLISICQTQAADVRKSGLLLIAFDFCDSLEF